MGDMADYYLDHDYDNLHYDEEPISKNVTCKYCGKKGLRWEMVEGKWRLFNKVKMHNCKVNPLRKIKTKQPSRIFS